MQKTMRKTTLTSLLIMSCTLVLSGCGSSKKNDTTSTMGSAPATPATEVKKSEPSNAEKKKSSKMTKPVVMAKADPNAKETKCTSGNDERILLVNPKDQGCELQYTKSGEMKVVATQIVGDTKCTEVYAQIKGKLEGSGFTCL